jgi:hypothetical protein
MESFMDGIYDFLKKLLAIGLLSGGLLIFAGELKIAALRKATKGTSSLSRLTQKMTKPVGRRHHGFSK